VFGLAENPDKYNEVVTKQYSWMDSSGGYLESQKHIQALVDSYF
jgi:hypothetical protein